MSKSKKIYLPLSEKEEEYYLSTYDKKYYNEIKGKDRYLRAIKVKRYSSGIIETKIKVECQDCFEKREVTLKDWKYQLKHLKKCECTKKEIKSKNEKTYIFRDYKSDKYLYLGKGRKSNGIQYIWLRCKDCGAIIEVNGLEYLNDAEFDNCFCYNLPPIEEITMDSFAFTNGYVKYSDDKIGIQIGNDILLGQGDKKYTVLVKCSLCGKDRIVREEEFFNERTNNYNFCSCVDFEKQYFIGARFGHLTLIGEDDLNFYFYCDCEQSVSFDKEYFKTHNLNNCGKTCKINKFSSRHTDREFIGQIYNNFRVLSILQRRTFKNEKLMMGTYWYCECLKCHSKDMYYAKEIYEGIKKSCICESMKYLIQYKPMDMVNGIMINDIFSIKGKGTLWQCICPICGDYFIRDPNSIVTGHCSSCGCKSISIGEATVNSLLLDLSKKIGLNYYVEYSFSDLIDKEFLRYDFAIKHNNSFLLIEYDGEQHFKPNIRGIRDKEKALIIFKDIQRRDKLKNEYAFNHNFPLLRIKYTSDKDLIRKQVLDFLKKEGVI